MSPPRGHLLHSSTQRYPPPRSGMGPVAQLVFKTSAVVQPTARSVRLRRRSVPQQVPYLQEFCSLPYSPDPLRPCPLTSAGNRLVGQSTVPRLSHETATVDSWRSTSASSYGISRRAPLTREAGATADRPTKRASGALETGAGSRSRSLRSRRRRRGVPRPRARFTMGRCVRPAS